MKWPGSYAKRVLWLFSSFTLFVVLAYSAVTFLIAFIVEDEVLERVMALEVQHLQRDYANGNRHPQTRVDYLRVYVGSESLPDFIARQLASDPDAEEVFTEGRDHFHVLRFLLAPDVEATLVADATELLSVSFLTGEVTFALVVLLLIFLLLALLLARWLAQYTVTPITQLSDHIQHHRHGPISLGLTRGGEEIAALARQFERTYNQLDQALQREGQFTRDISHELRTPLTTLTNLIALNDTRSWQQGDIEVLKHATAHMQDTVSVLLALARKDSMEDESVNLRALLERVVIERVDRLSEAGWQVELQLPHSLDLRANRQLLVLLAGNLIDNALNHGSGDTLFVDWKNGQLLFRNAYLGDQPENPQLPEQKGTHSDGLGQGLFLVTRICEALHWQPQVRAQNQWFEVVLTPPADTIHP